MKKISQIIAYSLMAVIVLGIILCAIIQINFKPNMNLPLLENGDKIQISVDENNKSESSNEIINYKEFVRIFDDSFKLTVLYSMFSGHLGNSAEIAPDLKSEPTYVGFKVEFFYGKEQTLKVDGKEVYIAENSNIPVKYKKVVFDVAKDKGLTDVKIYFEVSNSESSTVQYRQIKTVANFDRLYKYISEMTMFAE